MERRDQVGLGIGGAFTALVVGLLVTLFSKKIEVEEDDHWPQPPIAQVCTTAPIWANNEIEGVLRVLREQNLRYDKVVVAPCFPCTYIVEGVRRDAMCAEGAVAIDIRGQWYSETHVDETFIAFDRGHIVRASIMLPGVLSDDRLTAEDRRRFPRDAERLVLAHSLVHALGYGHSFTRISRGAISHKTGELMHPELLGMGWGFSGLP